MLVYRKPSIPMRQPQLPQKRTCAVGMKATLPASATASSLVQEVSQACSFSSIPVLNLSKLNGTSQERKVFLEDLRQAAHTVGFFYVTGHGFSSSFDTDSLNAARKLFALPQPAKEEFDYRRSASFRGYMALGVENTAGRVDQREQFEYGLEFPPLPPDVSSVQPPYMRLHGPNQWPDESRHHSIIGVRQALMAYLTSTRLVAERLLEALALAAGLPQDSFTAPPKGCKEEEPFMTVKVVRYPATEGVDDFGVGAHSDSGLITLLLQDDVGGLEALSGDGQWVPVPPLSNTLVVNLGELLQRASRGYYVATVHRVANKALPTTSTPTPTASPTLSSLLADGAALSPASPSSPSTPPSTTRRERISLPYFYNARLGQVVSPLQMPSELSWQRAPPAVESSTHNGTNRLLPVAGENVLKSFVRSHPHVARLHHPDLV